MTAAGAVERPQLSALVCGRTTGIVAAVHGGTDRRQRAGGRGPERIESQRPEHRIPADEIAGPGQAAADSAVQIVALGGDWAGTVRSWTRRTRANYRVVSL